MGLAAMPFNAKSGLAPELRLLAVTGSLSGLAAFSTFFVKVGRFIFEGRRSPALSTISLNLFGSLAATFLGLLLEQLIFRYSVGR